MPQTRIALLDGSVIDVDQPLIHADDLGLLRGDGVFETTLVQAGQPRDLGEHLTRLHLSASALQLDLPGPVQWRYGIDALVQLQPAVGEYVLRLVATRGREGSAVPTCFVMAVDLSREVLRERRVGVRVLLLDRGFSGVEVAGLPWLLAGAKSLSYAVNMAARRHAHDHGADDVIFMGSDGRVLEGPTSTVVIARRHTLVTPPDDGILAGVTVRRLFAAAAAAGWHTEVGPLTPADLDSADGIWLVSGVRLLAPVVAIDGRSRTIGPDTAELARALQVPTTV